MSENFSTVIDCPNCNNNSAVMMQHIQEIPYFGKIIIGTVSCNKCSFKLNDVISADLKQPSSFSVKIESEKDLTIKIVKSSSATVEIPELGILVEPGQGSDGYITNIEGLLDRMEAATKVLVYSNEDDKKLLAASKDALQAVQDARSVKKPFTVVVKDPFGGSALIGKKVEQKILSEKEISMLKKNITVFELQR